MSLEYHIDTLLTGESPGDRGMLTYTKAVLEQMIHKIRIFSRLDQFTVEMNSTFSDRDGNRIEQSSVVIMCKKIQITCFLSLLVCMTRLEIDHAGLEKMKEKIILAVLCFAWHNLSFRVRNLFQSEDMPLYEEIEADSMKYIFRTDCVKTEKDALDLIFSTSVQSYFQIKGCRF
jgi:hypothetical protein